MLVDVLLQVGLLAMPHVDSRRGVGTGGNQVVFPRDPLALLDGLRGLYLEDLLVGVLFVQIPNLDETIIRATDENVLFFLMPIETVQAIRMSEECMQRCVGASKVPDVDLPILITRRYNGLTFWIELDK